MKGNALPVYVAPAAAESPAASRVWSKAGVRVPFTGSTSMNCEPDAVVVRYQNRPSGSQVGRTEPPYTSGMAYGASACSARP